jgi:hypothetical protein
MPPTHAAIDDDGGGRWPSPVGRPAHIRSGARKSPIASLTAGLIGAALLSPGGAAAAQTGWYAGVTFGSSNARTDALPKFGMVESETRVFRF